MMPMAGTEQSGIGGPSEVQGNARLSKSTENAAPVRRGKAAAGRGPPPKRKKPSEAENQKTETSKDMGKRQKRGKKVKDGTDDIRNRASPFRLATVNNGLSGDQKYLLIKRHFGGLLNIASSMPVKLSQWVMRCYDPQKSELVIPERGRIPIDVESVSLMWDLPSTGLKVCWDVRVDVIKSVNQKFKIKSSNPPDLTTWCKKISDMNGEADDNFLQAYSMVAYSCLFAPTTSVKLCARCYPATSDPALIDQYNISQFVVDQLREAFMALGTKKSVCCFVYHLVLKYLDSLEVDEMISNCTPRANAWDAELINKVLNKDMLAPGVFGKLQLKEKFRDTAQGGLFGGLLKAEQFVAANVPASYDHIKKRKLSELLHGYCKEFEGSMTKWVKGIACLDEAGTSGIKHPVRPAANNRDKATVKRQRTNQHAQKEQLLPEESDGTDSDADNSQELPLDDNDSDEDEEESDNNEDEGHEESDGEKKDDDDEEDDESDDDDRSNPCEKDGGNNSDDDDDKDGGGNTAVNGEAQNVPPDSHEGGSGITAPDATTRQFVYRKRGDGNAKQGGKRKDGAAAEGEPELREPVSLFDICSMKIRSRLPDIPVLEVVPVWDDTPCLLRSPSDLSWLKPIPIGDLEQPLTHGLSDPSKYNDWFEESHGLRPAKTGATAAQPVTTTVAPTKGPVSASRTTSTMNQATMQSPKATVLPPKATGQATTATTHATEPSTKPPQQPHALPATAAVPTPQASNATAHGTQKCAPSKTGVQPVSSSTSFAGGNYIPPTTKNCPPPAPSLNEQTLDEVYNSLSRLNTPSPKTLLLPRTKSADSGFQIGIDQFKLPVRFNSGSKADDNCFNPFDLGPEFDEAVRTKECTELAGGPSCSFVGPKWDTTPRPAELHEHAVRPSFSSDGPQWDKTPGTTARPAEGYHGVQIIIDDDVLDACIEAEENYRANEQPAPPTAESDMSPSNFHTHAKLTEQVEGDCSSAGTKSSSAPELHARRIIKPTPIMQSPYTTKKTYVCSVEVNKLYAHILLYGRKTSRGQTKEDLSPDIINFGKYHVSLKELAESMKPGGWLHTSVVEIGIDYLMRTVPSANKKLIMPLRIATHMQNMDWSRAEIKDLFSKDKRLDKKDMVMLPVLQPLNPGSQLLVHHYFLFTINIRDRKFQVLDSWRSMEDKLLKEVVKKLKATSFILWEDNYPNSKVKLEEFRTEEIDVPKQTTNDDCGICTLMNAELWEGRNSPNYCPKDLPNIRKIMASNWVTALQNIVDWKDTLKKQHNL